MSQLNQEREVYPLIAMPMNYTKLNQLLVSRGLKLKDLKDVVSEITLAKLGKGLPVNTTTLCAICAKLHCDVEDIMHYEYDESECTKKNMNNRYK